MHMQTLLRPDLAPECRMRLVDLIVKATHLFKLSVVLTVSNHILLRHLRMKAIDAQPKKHVKSR